MNITWSDLNIKLLSFLLICCLILAVIVIGEWWVASHSYQNLLTSVDEIDEVADEVETMPEIKLAEQSLESYSAMVNRPLFTEGRKPIEDSEESTPLQEFTGNVELILTGLVDMPGGVTAMLRDNNNKHYRAKQGEEAQGWEVARIETDKIIIERGSDRKELMLRKPKLEQVMDPKKRLPGNRTRVPPPRRRRGLVPPPTENNDQAIR
jgi:hypothetical protein